MPRKALPISQRHSPDCRQPRDCACPWSFRTRLADGSMPRVTRDTWDEAEQAYYEAAGRRREPLADRTTTIDQWARRWLASATDRDGRPWRTGTVKARKSTVRNHVVPFLGQHKVAEVRSDDIGAWAAWMRSRGTGPVAQESAIVTLAAMFNAWQRSGRPLPYGNPVSFGLIPRVPRKEFIPWTGEEVDALVAEFPPDMRLIPEIEAYAGSRMSEVLGLREEDVIFTGRDPSAPLAPQLARLALLPDDRYRARKPRLVFQRQLDRVTGRAADTKNTAAHRALPLPRYLCEALAGHLETWPAVGGWVFTNPRRVRDEAGASLPLAPGPGGLDGLAVREERRMRVWALLESGAAVGAAAAEVGVSHATVIRDRGIVEAGMASGERDRSGALLPHALAGQTHPYSAQAYERRFREAAAAAGLTLPPRQLTHALRHHRVSVLRDAGWSDQAIGKWVGASARTIADVYGRPMGDTFDRIAVEITASRETRDGRRLRAVD